MKIKLLVGIFVISCVSYGSYLWGWYRGVAYDAVASAIAHGNTDLLIARSLGEQGESCSLINRDLKNIRTTLSAFSKNPPSAFSEALAKTRARVDQYVNENHLDRQVSNIAGLLTSSPGSTAFMFQTADSAELKRLSPGTHINVVATQNSERRFQEVIVRNSLVLAVSKSIEEQGASGTSLTFAVQPDEFQKLRRVMRSSTHTISAQLLFEEDRPLAYFHDANCYFRFKDWGDAEKAFAYFLKKCPTHSLANDAQSKLALVKAKIASTGKRTTSGQQPIYKEDRCVGYFDVSR